jgi:hypothetical protein
MPVQILANSDRSILNLCAKHLAREQGQSAESWRFPLVEPHPEPDPDSGASRNAVTFVHDARRSPAGEVGVIGTFANLFEPIPLQPVRWEGEETGYRALTVLVSEGELHTYRFIVDGAAQLDAINPQRAQLDDGSVWSRFFTDNCRSGRWGPRTSSSGITSTPTGAAAISTWPGPTGSTTKSAA